MSGSPSEQDKRPAGEVPTRAESIGKDDSATLERRYRRLLAWYPADYHGTYGEEMLGVLLAAAPPGRTRPSFADARNLAWSGLQARLGAIGTGTDPRWRDDFAVYSLLAPIVATVAIYGEPWFLGALLWRSPVGTGPLALPLPGVLLSSRIVEWVIGLLTIAAPLIPVIFALSRMRRTALILSAWLLIWVTVDASYSWQIEEPQTIAFIVLLTTEVAALAMSDGPRRALRLLTWKGALLASPWFAVAVIVALNEEVVSNGGVPSLAVGGKYYLLLAIATMTATLVSAKTRRVVLLFATPAVPLVTWSVMGNPKSVTAMCLAPAFVALITFVISRRPRRDADADTSPAIPAR